MKTIKYLLISILVLFLILYFVPYTTKPFEYYYQKKDKFSESLVNFKAQPTKSITVDGVIWNYYTGGVGDNCLVFIHGMGGAYDIWWNQIMYFEPQYKVISYTLPLEINSLEGAEKGILAILEHEKINQFIPIGTSMGGYIAQYLVQNHPNRIEKAVFGNTFAPNDFIKKSNAVKRQFIPLLPEYIVGTMATTQLKKDIFPTSENSEILEAFLLSVVFSKKGLAGRFDVVTDYFEPKKDITVINNIPKLILESDNDPMITPELRSKLKLLYPEAEVFTFHNKGHFPYINNLDQYNQRIKDFLEKKL